MGDEVLGKKGTCVLGIVSCRDAASLLQQLVLMYGACGLHLRLDRNGQKLFAVTLRSDLRLLGKRHLSVHGCMYTYRAVAEFGLRKQREHALEDARVLVVGITLHHGCWDAKHIWVSA